MSADHEITKLLYAWNEGDQQAFERLMPMVFDELQRIARRRFNGERGHHTLQPTALVNELFLRLVGDRGSGFRNRAQFFAAVADRMRHILIDHARSRAAAKRGGDRTLIPLELAGEVGAGGNISEVDLLALDQALQQLEANDPRKARIVTLRFFAGLTLKEAADVMELSLRQANREWAIAKVWLLDFLEPEATSGG